MIFLTDTTELQGFIGTTTLEGGRALWRGGKVVQCTLNEDEEGESRIWFVEGEVQGTLPEPYSVTVSLSFSEHGAMQSFEGDCSCPVGADCKHAVALALKAGAQTAAAASTDGAAVQLASTKVVAVACRAAPMQQVERWLERIDSVAQGARQAAEYDPSQEHPVYLLHSREDSAGGVPKLELSWQMARPLKRGGWSKPRNPPYGMEQEIDPQSPHGQAVRLFRALDGVSYGYGGYYQSNARKQVRGSLGVLTLQACASTGRLFMLDEHDDIAGAPLAWGETRTLEWGWEETESAAGQESLWQLHPRLHSPMGEVKGSSVGLFSAIPLLYIDTDSSSCGTVQAHGIDDAHLPELLAAPPFPASAFDAPPPRLLKQLAPLPWPTGVQALERWPACEPVPHLSLALAPPDKRLADGLVRAILRFEYGGLSGWWAGREPSVLAERSGGNTVLLTRDLACEDAAISKLSALGLIGNASGSFHQTDSTAWLDWATQDWEPLRNAGFELYLAPELDGLVQTVNELHVGVVGVGESGSHHENGGEDASWFDLSLGFDLGGERIDVLPWLPGWLAQVRLTSDGPRLPEWLWREQPDGRWLRLPSAPLQPWVNALLELVGERELSDGRLSRMEALRLAATLGEGAQWEGAAHLRSMIGQLEGAGALPEFDLPTGLRAELRPYQRHGFNWLQFMRAHHLGGVLADDMGLGKTLQTLAHFLQEKEAGRMDRPSLVIVPVSLLGNWRSEAERFAPDLRCRIWHGSDRHDSLFAEDCDVLIAPYSLLQRDRERWLKQRWHIVVLDEAQHIKNASTHTAQVVAALDARQRIALSGTPLENHLGELWSLFHFLMPGFLGSHKRFAELFRTPIEKQGDTTALIRLRQRVTPFILRRSKSAVATELPPLSESVIRVNLSGKQADLYETIRLSTEKAVRDALSERGLAGSQIQVLDALLKLRQVCCAPRLLKTEAAQKCKASAKLEFLMELLPPLIEEGRRILLFSQFTSMLTLIEDELARAGMHWTKLTGKTQKRDEAIERFTSGEVPLFLISLKAGGTGLNLQQADVVIHYDPWWNPAVEAQATGRAHRIGQARQVMVYKLVAEGTIEERILALQERKAALARGLLTGAVAREEPLFTENDVAELLKPLGA